MRTTIRWWLWLGLCSALAAHADPVGMKAYDFRYLPQLRTGSLHLASSADPSGGNDDRGHFVRREAGEAVLLECHQPGMIARIWSANPHGRLKIYFDDEQVPGVNLLFDRLAEEGPETPAVSGFVSAAGGGVSCWYPMPFAKSCKVVVEGAQQLYSQIDYWTYPPQTKVTTFRIGAAEQVGGGDWGEEHSATVTIPAGQGKTLLQQPGAQTIRRLILQPRPASFAALRQLRLQMLWDGSDQPSVDAPLLDFFAVGLGAGQYLSAPMSVAGWDFFQCDWPLPYAKGAVIRVVNGGQQPVTIAAAAYVTGGRRDDDGYFHAAWHQVTTEGGKPHIIAEATGRGQYVGAAVTLLGEASLDYLEGDERVVVDGTDTLQGTGTEDYFDGAWFFKNGQYATMFAGAPLLAAGKSQVAAYRWQIADCVPFRKSLKVTLEHGPQNDKPGQTYRSVGYWYGAKPQAVPASTVPAAPPDYTAQDPGAIIVEGESLADQVKLTGATARVTDDSKASLQASGGQLLDVRLTAAKDDEIALPVTVAKPGLYDLALRLVSGGPDFGWSATLDGEELRPPLAQATRGETIWQLGRARLDAKTHELAIYVTPYDPAAKSLGGFGLDYLRLVEVGKIKGALEVEDLAHAVQGQDSKAVVQGPADCPPEALRSTGVSGGAVPSEPVWSGGAQLRFAPARAGDSLTVTLPIESEGDYGLAVGTMRGPDYGLCEVSLDGRTVATIDGHSDPVLIGSRAGLGTHHLAAGEHQLGFKPLAGKERLAAVGLDYLLVEPAIRGHEAELMVRAVDGPAAEGQVKERFGAEPRWSGGAYVSFPSAASDKPVILTLFAPRSGKYKVDLTPARIPGGGQVKAMLGGVETMLECGGESEALGESVSLEGKLHSGANELRLWSVQPGDAIALDAVGLEQIGGAGLPIWLLAVLLAVAVIIAVVVTRKAKRS